MAGAEVEFMDLNDDCITAILHFLPLRDYWEMGDINERLRQLTLTHCPQRYRIWREPETQDPNDAVTNFSWMLKYMLAGLEQLELRATAAHLQLLRNHKLLQVKHLKVCCYEELLNVAEILARACPNVEEIFFVGIIDEVDEFSALKALTKLEVYHDLGKGERRWSDAEMKRVFANCKLRSCGIQWPGAFREFCAESASLEELLINIELLPHLELQALPNIKSLAFLATDQPEAILVESDEDDDLQDHCVVNFLGQIAKRISRLAIHYNWFPLLAFDDSQMHYNSDWIGDDWCAFCGHMKSIVELYAHISHLQILNKDTQFFGISGGMVSTERLRPADFLAQFRSLDILGVPIQWLDEALPFADLDDMLRKQKRQRPLELHCFVAASSSPTQRTALEHNLKKRENADLLRIQVKPYPGNWNWKEIGATNSQRPYIEIDLHP